MPHYPKFVDTHGHVQFNAFKDDGHDVLKKTLAAGTWVIMPGTQIDTSRRAVEFAQAYKEGVYAAIGLHPIHLEDSHVDESEVGNQGRFRTRREEFRRASYENLLASSKVVAIGEVGLDYWRKPKTAAKKEAYKRRQIDTFVQQLDLANDHKLPLILHCRVAFEDLLMVIEGHPVTFALKPPGVVHCYTGDVNSLRAFLALGYYIGYTGIIFKLNLDEVIKETPLDRMLLETDAPYLTPPALPDARNEPLNVRYVAHRIAELKGVSLEEVALQTTINARKVFRI